MSTQLNSGHAEPAENPSEKVPSRISPLGGTRLKWIGRLVALAIGLILMGLAELAFRLFTPFPPTSLRTYRQDSRYMYFHAPDSLGYEISPWNEFPPVKLRYNAHGFRGPAFPQSKPAGEKRIFLLGDSFVEARQLKEAQTVSVQMENALRPLLGNVRVVNAGCSAYTTTTEYLLLKHHVLAFQPDAVVLFVAFNDYCDNFWYGNYSQYKDVFSHGLPASLMPSAYSVSALRPATFKDKLTTYSAIAAFMNRQRNRAAPPALQPTKELVEPMQFHRTPRQVNKAPLDEQEQAVLEFTHEGIRQIAALCREHRIPLTLTIIPLPPQVSGQEWKRGRVSYGWRENEQISQTFYQDRLKTLAKELGTPCLDLLEPYRNATANGRVFLDYDGHLSARGHAIAARELADRISPMLNDQATRR